MGLIPKVIYLLSYIWRWCPVLLRLMFLRALCAWFRGGYMKMCEEPLELSTRSNSALRDWSLLKISGISETKSDLEITWEGLPWENILYGRLTLLLFILSWFIMIVLWFSFLKSFHDIVLLVLFYFPLYLVSSWKAIPDSQSFLFTLVNPSGNEPMKINPKPGAAIRCRSDAGPAFGDSRFFDFVVWSPHCASGLSLGYGFTCPENVNSNTFFTGGSSFQVTELEVFKVNL